MRAPAIDLTSEAHQQLKEDAVIETAGFPAPIAQTLGHVERLIFAGDDQALGVAHLLAKPEPSWFGHLAVVRSAVESLSRVWNLTEPGVPVLERATRMANELLAEIQHAESMLAGDLAALPSDVLTKSKEHVANRRAGIADWAKTHGVANPGGYLAPGRPRPLGLVGQLYESEGRGLQGAAILGAWNYSTLSSPAHGLPEGIAQYVQSDPEPHLELSAKQLVRSVEPLVTAYEATTHRLSTFFRWPVGDGLLAELTATRMFINRAGGLMEPESHR